MNDILLELFESGPDMVLDGGDLATTRGLGQSVLVSLFSDARASDEELDEVGGDDPRGWWAEDDGDRFGSKIWLLSRSKIDALTIQRLADYCREALAWMRDRDVAEQVNVSVERSAEANRLDVSIEIRRGRARGWSQLWEGIADGSEQVSTIGDARLRILYR